MMANKLLKGLKATHPGEVLREDVVPALGKTKTEIASLLGVSRVTLHDILSEKAPVTPNLALRIGKLVGNGPEVWLRMQQAYDLEEAAKALASTLKKIPTLAAAE